MITKLYVDNYKTLVDFTVEFQPLTLIVGGNGTGKSAIMEVIHSIANLMRGNGDLRKNFSRETLSKFIEIGNLVQNICIISQIKDCLYEYTVSIGHNENRDEPYILNEKIIINGNLIFEREKESVKWGSEYPLTFLPPPFFPQQAGLYMSTLNMFDFSFASTVKLKEFYKFICNEIGSYKINPFTISGYSKEEENVLDKYCQNFSAWYRHNQAENPLKLPELYSEISGFMPGFTFFRLSGAEGRRAIMCEFSDGVKIDFDYLSEGQKSLILLYSILIFSEGREVSDQTLIFDEPENFISLKEIQPWLRKVEDWVEEGNGQVILISHHPETMNYEGDDSLVWLERENGGPTRLKSREDIAAGYGLLLSDRFSREA